MTGWDPVTWIRDSETVSAGHRAFRGPTPSRYLPMRRGPRIAKTLCLLTQTGKARCGAASCQKCLFAKALPEWLFRYLSTSKALALSRNATAVSMRQGANFDVCGTLRALWA